MKFNHLRALVYSVLENRLHRMIGTHMQVGAYKVLFTCAALESLH